MTCAVSDCQGRAGTRGWCGKHYTRWLRHGDPTRTLTLPWPDNLLQHLEEGPDGCILYTGRTVSTGYGRVTDADGEERYAHRAAYELFVGPIPEGHHLDHLCHALFDCLPGSACHHRRCVNIDHLEPVTPAENARRAKGKRAVTHCPQGHPYDEANTYIHPTTGGRRCCACWGYSRRVVSAPH